jgi:hypothetical protein
MAIDPATDPYCCSTFFSSSFFDANVCDCIPRVEGRRLAFFAGTALASTLNFDDSVEKRWPVVLGYLKFHLLSHQLTGDHRLAFCLYGIAPTIGSE